MSAVTDYLTKLGQNASLTLKQLSQKLCMLMELTCAERSSIMATSVIRYMRRYPAGIKFLHSTFRKRSIRGNLCESVYPKVTQALLLCAVQCPLEYLERTKDFQPTDNMQRRLYLAL